MITHGERRIPLLLHIHHVLKHLVLLRVQHRISHQAVGRVNWIVLVIASYLHAGAFNSTEVAHRLTAEEVGQRVHAFLGEINLLFRVHVLQIYFYLVQIVR